MPFTVVTDWLQEGRLLKTDRVRISGKEKWHMVEAVPALVPYLPKPAALAAEDKAEARSRSIWDFKARRSTKPRMTTWT